VIDPSLQFLVEPARAQLSVSSLARLTFADLERHALEACAYDAAGHDPGDECSTVRRE